MNIEEVKNIMKDIQNMKSKELVIDPSIELENSLDELLRNFKIKIISWSDNEEILTNLYYVMKVYFSEAVIDDVIKSCLDKAADEKLIINLRDKKINDLLK